MNAVLVTVSSKPAVDVTVVTERTIELKPVGLVCVVSPVVPTCYWTNNIIAS